MEGCEMQWILETYTDADWSSNRSHRKSTSCAVHFINGFFVHGSSKDVPSSSFQRRFNLFSGLTTVLHDNVQPARALDVHAIC